MKIDEEEAWIIYHALKKEDKQELKIKVRIMKEFPLIYEKLREKVWHNYLWEVGAEKDERVIKRRDEVEKIAEELRNLPVDSPDYHDKQSNFCVVLNDIMRIKQVIVQELLKEGDKNENK